MIEGIAACSSIFRNNSLEEALDALTKAGYRYVELAAMPGWCEHISEPPTDQDFLILRNRMRRFGIRPVAISAHRDFTQKQQFPVLCRIIECAAFIGCRIVVTSPGSTECEMEERRAVLKKLDKCCEQYGVTLALEPHGTLGSGALLSAFIHTLDCRNIKMCYDTANVLYFAGAAPLEDINVAMGDIVHIHLKDKIDGQGLWNFPPPGKGQLPLREIVQQIRQSEYNGYLSVEIEYTPERTPAYGELCADARQAREYIESI